jgi:ABC-type amino acid transport substrate-binding protein
MNKFFALILSFLIIAGVYGDSRSLKSPLRVKSPYHILQNDGKISGLDAEIVALIFLETAGLDPATYDQKESSWEDALKQVEKGEKDFIANVTKTPGREKWGIFSDPYRNEEHVVLAPKEYSGSFDNASGFIKEVKDKNLKIAVVKGVKYNSKEINAFLDSSKGMLVFENSFEDVVTAIMDKKADLGLVEQVNAMYTLTNQNKEDEYKVIKIGASEPQRLLFSKATVNPKLVEMVNKTIGASAEKIKDLFANYTTKDNTSNWLLPEGKTTLLDMLPKKDKNMSKDKHIDNKKSHQSDDKKKDSKDKEDSKTDDKEDKEEKSDQKDDKKKTDSEETDKEDQQEKKMKSHSKKKPVSEDDNSSQEE